MSVESYRVAIGACGWKHQAWHGDFYPQELPEDWLLGYYANEFPVVYVPVSDWVDEAGITDWTDGISESFRFILQLPASCIGDEACFIQALKKAESLQEYCLGLVLQLDEMICGDIIKFQSRLEAALKIAPVCVDTQGLDIAEELQNILVTHEIAEVWDGSALHNCSASESSKPGMNMNIARGKLAIAHVSGEGLDAAGIRKVLETLLSAETPDRINILCIDGDPPSLEVMRNADIILNLL